MPVKSGFRPRPKAFTGARKPFNLAEAQANADSGWPRRKPESESSQTSQSKSRSAYDNVKDKFCGFFKRGPANTHTSSDAAREARNRKVADELFPPDEPVATQGRRERVIEFDLNTPFEPMVLDTQPNFYDAVMDDNASVFSWSSAETLVNDVKMHDDDDDTSDLDYILHFNSPKAQEDCGQDSLCERFVSQLIIKSEETSGDASLMDVDEDLDELVDVTMLSLSGDDEPFLGDGEISMEVLVPALASGSLSGSGGITAPTSILEANVGFYSREWAAPRDAIRTAKSTPRSFQSLPYSRQNTAPSRSRPRSNPLAGLEEFINGGPSRGSKGRLVTKFSTLLITPVTIVAPPLQSAPPPPQPESGPIPPAASPPTITDACNNSDKSDDEPMSYSSPDEAAPSVDGINTIDSLLSSINLGDDPCDLPDFEDVEKFYTSAAGRSEKMKENRKHVACTPYTRPTISARNKDATAPLRPKKVRFAEDPVDLVAQRLEELANQIASLNVAEEEETNEEPPVESNTPVSDREALLFIIDALEDVQQYN
ncbi:hypothetical protein NLI96_g10832 [Meripilus lineatus]|uniref:Uncharacterized protein n=1 Tax=Meripilus lineatus TaxID=2056292 RepID=A0AAD5YBK1_9APHY|nr:hypothetical protein NLI96_g10832 [Physisporinus lineatus]